MADSQMICQGCGKQFKNREELQKHETECAAMKHIQAGQEGVGNRQGQGAGGSQSQRNQQGGNQSGAGQGQSQRTQQGANQPGQGQSQRKNQPEKTRTAGGGGGMNQDQERE